MESGELERRRPLGRLSKEWEYNIKTDLIEIVWGGDWIHLAQDREPVECCCEHVITT